MPPLHHDAIGYIRDLANEEDSDWFRYLCDAAIERSDGQLSAFDKESLFALLDAKASYLRRTSTAVATAGGTPTPDHLEEIGSFTSFKRLGASLKLSFPKRISIVFGTNGSGKSSLCEALKALADTTPPVRPLHNVTESPTGTPSFSYKLKNAGTPATWAPTVGHGLCAETIKYFDSSLASKSLIQNVDPGKVISLIPFHLGGFGRLQEMTTGFKSYCMERKGLNRTSLETDLEKVKALFVDFPESNMSTLTSDEARSLKEIIEEAEGFKDHESLAKLLKEIETLEKGLTEEGLRLLRAEVRDLADCSRLLSEFIFRTQMLWYQDIIAVDEKIEAKSTARKELNELVSGTRNPPEEFNTFVEYAASKCDLSHPEDKSCPLCKQPLQIEAQNLFKSYHEYISGEIAQEIRNLKKEREVAEGYAQLLADGGTGRILESSAIDPIVLTRIGKLLELLGPFSVLGVALTQDALDAVEELKSLSLGVSDAWLPKHESLHTLLSGRAESEKELKRLKAEAQPLQILEICSFNIALLSGLLKSAKIDQAWGRVIGDFPALLRKITAKSKFAHEELIVADFETRLDTEYQALTNRTLEEFGVTLQRQGRESSVTVAPNIFGSSLSDVLSEGEQRVHSLALFFAELESCPHSVIVFDDPVSSFDYNYITSYCRRLRKFAIDRPDRQIVVLMHNWEFFVQLQVTLNKAGLNNFLSVQVIENCCTSASYSEKIDDLKTVIDGILSDPSEPSREQKETAAGSMRRLIEAVVNTHVFANQRHQYKQKTLQVSAFGEFTKVVALESTEAQQLSDLYSDLSITEHDDPRNAYVNTDRATFISRYDQIKAIETAIEARKAP
tara:strand:+ start:563 stop:3097 length:2535 start_codon:yes stop_codon:yes gene_type:complete